MEQKQLQEMGKHPNGFTKFEKPWNGYTQTFAHIKPKWSHVYDSIAKGKRDFVVEWEIVSGPQ